MLQRMFGNAAALAVGGAVAQLLFITIEIVLARHFLSADYGMFSTVQAIALTGLIVLDFGMHWQAIEAGSRDPQRIPVLLGTTIVIKIVFFGLLWPLSIWLLTKLGYDAQTVSFFSLFFFFSLSMALQDSLGAVYTAEQKMTVNAFFQGGVALVVAVLVALVLVLGSDIFGVAAAYVAGSFAVTAVWLAFTWRRHVPQFRLGECGDILKGSYLYGLTGLLVHVFRKGDILLLSGLGTLSQVGIYAAASKLLDFAYKIPFMGSLVVSPELFRQSDSDESLFRKSADLFVRFNLFAGILLAIVIFHNAGLIIGILFGEQYAESAAILRVLSASFALKFLHYALQTVLTTKQQHGTRTGALAAAMLIALAGYLVLIPRLGAIGAAYTVVLSEFVLTALYVFGLQPNRFRLLIGWRVLLTTLVAVLAIGAPLLAGLDGIPATFVSVLAAAVLFVAGGLVTRDEVSRAARKIRK